MDSFEHAGFWWNPLTPDTKWPGTLRYSPTDGSVLTLILPPPKRFAFFNDEFPEYKVLVGETKTGQPITLFRCFYRNRDEIFANAAIVGFHAESDDPLISTAAVVVQHIGDWWGRGSINFDHSIELPSFNAQYTKPDDVILSDTPNMRVHIGSGLSFSSSSMKASLAEEIRIEFNATEPQPLSVFQKQIHACKDLLSVACLRVCEVEALRLRHPGGEFGSYHAIPIFTDPSDQSVSWPNFLLRFQDIRDRAKDVFSTWLACAEQLLVVRSLYLSAAYGEMPFVQIRLLSLVQAAEAYHRRCYTDRYMGLEEYASKVIKPMQGSIPKDVDPSLQVSLHNRLKYGNEYSFVKRMNVLREEHEPALACVVPNPARWIERVVEQRHALTHHAVTDESRVSIDSEELLRCNFVLRVLLEQCFLKSAGLSDEERHTLSARCQTYRMLKRRFFTS
jgi:ApeA N-terminal domain 1